MVWEEIVGVKGRMWKVVVTKPINQPKDSKISKNHPKSMIALPKLQKISKIISTILIMIIALSKHNLKLLQTQRNHKASFKIKYLKKRN